MSGWRFALSGMRLTIYFCHCCCAYINHGMFNLVQEKMVVGLMNLSDHLFISRWLAATHGSLGFCGWLVLFCVLRLGQVCEGGDVQIHTRVAS
jgi:hypothetical protein